MNQDLRDAHLELSKWLNEEQTKPIDRVALATVLWSVAQQIDALHDEADLTDSEIRKIQSRHPTENDPMPFARAVLAAQKEKND